METEKNKDFDWTVYGLCDILDVGGKEIRSRLDSSPLPDDEDAAAAKKDYEEGPQAQIGGLGSFEYCVITAAMEEDADASLTAINNFLFEGDVGRGAFKEKRLAEEDAWKDKPYGKTVPAPVVSALKFGKEGMNASWGVKLLWLVVVLVLNWVAWAIIG